MLINVLMNPNNGKRNWITGVAGEAAISEFGDKLLE